MLGACKEGIIGVSDWPVAIESLGLRGIEGEVVDEAAVEVGIGDVEAAESDGIGLAGGDDLFCGVAGEFLIGDNDTLESLLDGG